MGEIDKLREREDVPVVVADMDGRITFVNGKFTEEFGWSSEEVRGRLLTIIIPPAMHDAHHMGFSRFLKTGTGGLLNKPMKLRARAKDGREFDAEHLIVAEKRNGRWRFAASIKPLGAR